MQIHFMKSKLCISPIISVILILVVTTISVTSFLLWYSSYESNLNTKIESTVNQGNSLSIETIAGSVLYVKSNENTTIKSIKLDNNICSLDLNLTAGINEIDISTCLNNLTRSNPSVSLVSDNQVLSKNIYIKELNKYPTIQHGCTLDGISLEHGENYSFYQNIFSFNCSNEVSVLFCDNGVLEHSDTYKYHSCNTYNSCSIGGQTLEHNTSQIFYFKSFDEDGCINETRTCNNGVLNGSYTYTTCSQEATEGGDVIYDLSVLGIDYKIHIFKTTGSSQFIANIPLDIDYIIVAGGASTGGAGGLLVGSTSLDIGTYSIIVGAGGTSGVEGFGGIMGSGHNSSIKVNSISIEANGGGTMGSNGGSGGGGSGAGTPGQGNDGGSSSSTENQRFYGGAGGAGEVGAVGISSGAKGGNGLYAKNGLNFATDFGLIGKGVGQTISSQVWFSGGGAGAYLVRPYVGGSWSVTSGTGGSGGGGTGWGGAGLANSGGGGAYSGSGGSGVVIIRYAIN